MSDFTKGPWAVIGDDANGPEHDSIPFIDVGRWDETDSGSSSNRSIAEVCCTITDDEFVITDEDRANARLIASAPDLLEALEAVLPLAKGYDGHKRYPSAREPNKRIIKAAEAAITKAKSEQDG